MSDESESLPPPYFQVESELWQDASPLKLNWTTRKVAIYLREAASHDPDHVALRSVKRIMANLDLSKYQVESAIKKLRSWPSRRKRFVQCWDKRNSRFVLRPIPQKDQQHGRTTSEHTKVYRWFWELQCPDVMKDIFLFICSQFETKDSAGNEVFRCSKFGRKAPSIINCCYIPTDGKLRRKHPGRLHEAQLEVVSGVVKILVKTGLLTVLEEASSRSPALVRAHAAEAIPSLQKRYAARRALAEPPAKTSGTTSGEQAEPPAGFSGTTSEKKRNHHTIRTRFQNPLPEPATTTRSLEPPLQPQAAAGAIKSLKQGGGQSPLATSESQPSESPLATSLAPLMQDERHRSLVLEVEIDGFFLNESKHDRRHLAQQVTALLQELPDDLHAADLIHAVQDGTFEGIDRSWGLLLSPKFRNRFVDKILDHYGERKSLEKSSEKTRFRLQQMLNSDDPATRLQAIPHLRTWYQGSRLADLFSQYLERVDLEPVESVTIYREISASNGSLSPEDRRRLVPVCESRLHGAVGEELEYLELAISALTERR